MIIHFHHTTVPNAGETKRMKNIDKYVAGVLSDKVVEVEFYRRDRIKYVHSEGKFTLSDKVVRKYYILHFPRLGKIDCIYRSLVLSYLGLKYKPNYLIGEMGMFPTLRGIYKRIVKNCKIIFDVHGATVEEAKYQSCDRRKVEITSKIESYSIHAADYIICQSDEMKRYIVKVYGVNQDNICVFRCGVDTSIFHFEDNNRKQVRQELGVSGDEILFVYSGGMHLWQRIEDSLHLFQLYNSHNPKSKYLVITLEQDRFLEILKKEKYSGLRDKILIESLVFEEVPIYLCAADIAFLLRHNHVMNTVASPTKLAEYMACGLPIITSQVAEKWVMKDGFKFLLFEDDMKEDVKVVDRIIDTTDKCDITRFAKDNLSLEADIKNIKLFFSKIL